MSAEGAALCQSCRPFRPLIVYLSHPELTLGAIYCRPSGPKTEKPCVIRRLVGAPRVVLFAFLTRTSDCTLIKENPRRRG